MVLAVIPPRVPDDSRQISFKPVLINVPYNAWNGRVRQSGMILTGSTGQFPQVRRRCPETVEKRDAFGSKQDKESAGILRKSKENPSCGDFMKVGSEPANRRALGLQTVRRCSKIGATLAFGAERRRVREWHSPSLEAKNCKQN